MIETLLPFGVLATALLGLAAWAGHRTRQRQTAGLRNEMQEAERTGTHRPLAQHPLVDPFHCVGCGLCIQACPEEQVLGLVDGVAKVVHGSRCIGHGHCEKACPVGALKVGLGDISGRDDIPRLTPAHESTVPGLFVVGELSGIALIRHAIDHGRRAIDEIERRIRQDGPTTASLHDVVIVGAGPAGISASLQAVAAGLGHITLEQGELGGTVRHYPRQKLVMTQPVDLPLHGCLDRSEYQKEELEELFQRLADDHPLNVQGDTRLQKLRREGDHFVLETSRGEVAARFVVLALGRRGTPRTLGVPGEDSTKVAYRLLDAASFQDRDVLVVGGGDSAVEAALALAAQPGNRVTLSYRRENFFRIKSRNLQKVQSPPRSLTVRMESQVTTIEQSSVTLETTGGSQTLANDHVFVFAGGHPPYPLLKEAGVGFGADAD